MQGDRREPSLILQSLIPVLAMQSATSAEPPPSADADFTPAVVFRQVCLRGGMRLDRGSVSPVTLEGLPESLRAALDAYLTQDGLPEPFRRYSRLGPDKIPNNFLRLRGFPAYLMMPQEDAAPLSVARYCAVFWRGNHWDHVREAVRGWIVVPEPAARPGALGGRVAMQNEFGGHLLTVANYGGWTMMRTMPVVTRDPAEKPN